MLRRSWQAGLQLEIAKRIITVLPERLALDHSATLVLSLRGCNMLQLEAAKRIATAE